MKIDQAFEDFDLANRANLLSPKTLKWYASILRPVVAYFADCEVEAITTKQVRQYVVSLQERDTRYPEAKQRPTTSGGLERASVIGHITAIKAFFAWCASEYEIPDAAKPIKRPKPIQPEPKAIAQTDFMAIFNATLDTAAGERDRAMLAAMADAGVRISELLSMKINRLDLPRRRVWVMGKGNKGRYVYFTHYTTGLLQIWLKTRKSSHDAVWIAMDTFEPLTTYGVYDLLKRLKERARVEGRVNPHSFRHNFAREYIKNGGDVVTLAKLLGHTSIEVTAAFYAVFSDDELQRFHDQHSPMEGWDTEL